MQIPKVPKAITFDCYGTLVDWEGEIQKFFKGILDNHGVKNVDYKAVQREWEMLQFDYIQEKYRPYRQILKDTLPMAFNKFNLPFTDEDCETFAQSMGKWAAFPDTRDAIIELQKYTKVIPLTNTENAIIRETEKNLGVKFDDIITAEDVGAYKPSHKGFHYALNRLGLDKSEVWHAAFGFKYDIVPAHELGITSCWINRQGEVRSVDVAEDYLVGDMKSLAILIRGMACKE
ncbi:haloacid dehalogenase type II [Fusibacter ferrireducens]|uniref:Haloacid dehalogenase type II n=1 Tax=Fusibacter ferrireducens TaxID=2785058 RepID=A0ABR9ZTY0_9FIRM|nr:haloacid dehalogenase type II [Fusibacter ferrireducens]MBF4693941.1 haloacid dehalogenase type II [Fusibacter ferrireducens]